METDLPGDGRFVLTERSGNSGLGRVVTNTDLDDPSFIEGDVKMFIRRSHKRYLRSKRGIQIWTKIMIHAGRVNATCSSWRLNATLSPLELHLLFHFTIIKYFHHTGTRNLDFMRYFAYNKIDVLYTFVG